MLIQYFSDLHLEFGPLIYPQTEADLIIAAGDIGIYQQGIEWLNTIEKPVLYVAGNHEFYHHEYYDTMETLQNSCENTNIQFLNKKTVVMGDIRFLGCTLWINAEKALSEGKSPVATILKKFAMKMTC